MPFEMHGYKHFLHYVLCFAPIQSDPRAVPPRDPSQNRGQGLEKASVSRSVSPNRRAHKFCQVFLSVSQSQGLGPFLVARGRNVTSLEFETSIRLPRTVRAKLLCNPSRENDEQ